jgi:phosphate starvation-inducible PhoH-like protein
LNDDQRLQFVLEPGDTRRLARLCGQFDEHLHLIEQRLGVHIRNRGNHFTVEGPEDARNAARAVLIHLYDETARHLELDPEQVHLRLQQSGIDALREAQETPGAADGDVTSLGVLRVRRALIRPRTTSISASVRPVPARPISRWRCAVDALEREQVRRILLVRPAVEAGEKLGFLPGDLAQKVDPYLRPLYDALYEMLGFETREQADGAQRHRGRPLAYMRGRTLNHAFVILDEARTPPRSR